MPQGILSGGTSTMLIRIQARSQAGLESFGGPKNKKAFHLSDEDRKAFLCSGLSRAGRATGTRTQIGPLGGDSSIQLNYGPETFAAARQRAAAKVRHRRTAPGPPVRKNGKSSTDDFITAPADLRRYERRLCARCASKLSNLWAGEFQHQLGFAARELHANARHIADTRH